MGWGAMGFCCCVYFVIKNRQKERRSFANTSLCACWQKRQLKAKEDVFFK